MRWFWPLLLVPLVSGMPLLRSPASAGERGQAGADGECATQWEPAPGRECGRGKGWGCGGRLAQAGDRFWQEGGQLGCEVEVVEAVPLPVFLQRLGAGQQEVAQLGQQEAGDGEVGPALAEPVLDSVCERGAKACGVASG